MNYPTNVKYTKEHEWIRQEGDVAYVGITDYAQQQLGDQEQAPAEVSWRPQESAVTVSITRPSFDITRVPVVT